MKKQKTAHGISKNRSEFTESAMSGTFIIMEDEVNKNQKQMHKLLKHIIFQITIGSWTIVLRNIPN